MITRLALLGSLLWLAACDDQIIGSTRESVSTDGGLTGSQADEQLAKYARDLRGTWQGMSDDGVATLSFTFTPSEVHLRSGIVDALVEVDCTRAILPFGVCDPDPRRPPRPKIPWVAEYWLLKLEGEGATVSMLPNPDELVGFSFTCLYVPGRALRSEQAELQCGITVAGFPLVQTVLKPSPL